MAAGTWCGDLAPRESAANWQKSNNYQHVADKLWSDGCVTTDDNVEGCCWVADKHLSTIHQCAADRLQSNGCVATNDIAEGCC